jgi:hypothetical protein
VTRSTDRNHMNRIVHYKQQSPDAASLEGPHMVGPELAVICLALYRLSIITGPGWAFIGEPSEPCQHIKMREG